MEVYTQKTTPRRPSVRDLPRSQPPAPEHVNARDLRPPPHQLSDVSLLKAVNCLMFDDDC